MPVKSIYATGGISQKNAMAMQVFADICKRPILISSSKNSGARGSAVLASLAAGTAGGGYDRIEDATAALASDISGEFRPNPDNAALYDALYAEYTELHDFFGRGGSDLMKRLRGIQKAAIVQKAEQNLVERYLA